MGGLGHTRERPKASVYLAHTARAYPPTRLQSLSEEQNYSFELHTQSGGCVAHQGRGLTSQKPSGWFSQ